MKIKKSDILIITSILCVIAFIVPMLIFLYSDSFSSILTLSFTAVSTIASLATFVIAAMLYDRFNLDNKFLDKQADAVLDLIDELKGRVIIAKAKGFSYYIRPSPTQANQLAEFQPYQINCNKEILISNNDYEKSTWKIISLKRSYWLPKEIKDKMQFLEFALLQELDSPEHDNFVRLDFGTEENKKWGIAYPETTLAEFVNNLVELVLEIEEWLKKYSSISIDLKLEEYH